MDLEKQISILSNLIAASNILNEECYLNNNSRFKLDVWRHDIDEGKRLKQYLIDQLEKQNQSNL